MRVIKFRYTMKHKPTGNIHVVYYYLSQIERRPLKELSVVFSDEHEMLSRDIYTGLKDKNGKEIYEEDVWEGYKNFLVRYNQDYAGFEPFVNDGGCGCCADGDVGQVAEHGKVIGNIHEHPHLLEGDN